MDLSLLIAGYAEQHHHRGWPRQRMLHECLRAAIRSGTLAAGTRLAASRALAEELGLARNTVLYAYEQLASEGFVTTDRRGTVVATIAADRKPSPSPQVSTQARLAQRARGLRALPGPAEMMGAFVPGVPALDHFPLTLWRRMLERAWRSLTVAQLNYGDPAGEPTLRAAIADHLRAARGAQCGMEQIFITSGTQSSLDLCARAFADAGDKAWIENPGYGGASAALRGAQLKVVGIATDADGIHPSASDWRRHRPKLIYTTPSHQYPTGSVLTLERRLDLIARARSAGALVIEDDYDSEFRHDGPPLPAMQGLAPDAPVVYLGTFSKTMFPALRLGFMVVPQALAEPLEAVLARSAPAGRTAEQLALAQFLRGGQFALHLRRMRRLYKQRRDALVSALETHLGHAGTVHGGSAGMHLAFQLADPRRDDRLLSEAARKLGIVAPALRDHATGARANGWNGFLLGYAQVPADKMDALVRTLARSMGY